MSTVQYHRLCKLSVHHEYYQGGLMRDLKVVPDRKTHTFMSNAGLVYKQFETGLEIYRPGSFDKDYIEELIEFFGEYYLEFNLHSQNPAFFNFTASSMDELAIFRFDNRKTGAEGRVMEPTLETNIAFGQYFGKVQLYLEQFIEGDDLVARQYEAHFEARPTQIDYLVANIEPGAEEEFSIQDSEGNLFEPPQAQTSNDGRLIYRFSSGEKSYKIQERERLHRSLKRKLDLGDDQEFEEVVIDKLPSPSPHSLTKISKPATSDEDVARSTLYIYL